MVFWEWDWGLGCGVRGYLSKDAGGPNGKQHGI